MPQSAAGAGSDGQDVERIEPDVEHGTYQGCPDGRCVEFDEIEHGDHLWPGMPLDRPD